MLCWSRKCHCRGSFSLPFDVACPYPLAPSLIARAGRHPRPWRPRDSGRKARHKARSPRRGGERRQRRFLAGEQRMRGPGFQGADPHGSPGRAQSSTPVAPRCCRASGAQGAR